MVMIRRHSFSLPKKPNTSVSSILGNVGTEKIQRNTEKRGSPEDGVSGKGIALKGYREYGLVR